MPEDLILYVFNATNDEVGEITHTYAHSEGAARVQLQAWMAEQVTLGREDITVTPYPDGFRPGTTTYWPGRVPAQPESEQSHE